MPLTFSGGTLLLTVPRQADGRTPWSMAGWVWDWRAGVWRCDAIHYGEIAGRLAAGEGRCDDRVPQWQAVSWPKVALPELRPDQQQACAAWQETQRGVIVMPTGTGKTEVALAIMRDTAVSTLVVSPVRDLMYQWHRRILRGLGYDAGIIGDGVYRVSPVSVTTYDSACIHMERLGAMFGLIVFDECHHLPGDVRRDAARMSAAPRRLGLTATPERADGRQADLDELIGPVVYHQSISAARGTTLAEYDVVRIPIHLSDDEQRRYDELSAQVRRFMIAKRSAGSGDQRTTGSQQVGCVGVPSSIGGLHPVPSPPSSGERARVRGPSGKDLPKDTNDVRSKSSSSSPLLVPVSPPHPNPLPPTAGGEGTRNGDHQLATAVHGSRPPPYSWQDLCAETGRDPAARRALRAFRLKQAIEERAEEKLRVLEDLFRLHADGPVIVFVGSNAMARDVSRRFLIPCLLSHCRKHERLDILEGLCDGSYPALVANQVLDEGVDLPEVKVAVVIGGRASTRQAKQRLGRILRKSGRARAVMYEVVCSDTGDERRSRQRRGSDAYQGTRHRRM